MIILGLALVAAGLALMYGLDADSGWTALLAGFVAGGIGIGIANPALAAGALRGGGSGANGDGFGGSATPSASQAWQSGSRRSAPYSRTEVENSLSITAGDTRPPSVPR